MKIRDFFGHLIGRHSGTKEIIQVEGGWLMEVSCCWDCGRMKFERVYPEFR